MNQKIKRILRNTFTSLGISALLFCLMGVAFDFAYKGRGTNRVTIKMVDKTSKKVIREYPPEETLDMLAKIWELAGMMIDEKG